MAPELPPKTKAFISSHRVARLATADASGRPHAVPITYAFDGESIYSALDLKPKRVEVMRLRRVRNILENPSVALVIDDYSEDWSELAYVLVFGKAAVMEEGGERDRAESLLREKYPQYEELLEHGCVILRIAPERVISWGRV
ncbi:MAG: TIGR03668 family PPOX class F420-dependent oxidoreductase [Chloroflexi bacterium]|nr:TIGR03668 family PPOX class F420-dependent oxidoreductase [Chloroflexota bacterium]